MHALAYPRTLIALGIGVAAAAATWLLGGDAQVALLVLVAAVAAVLVAAREPEPVAQSPAPPPSSHPLPDTIIEAIGEPVLLIGATRVLAANLAARTLLGEHITGEDVRVAIRHPAAAERLLAPKGGDSEPIHLVGLGTREQRWEMRIHPVGNEQRIVHLVDRTGSYATERMRVDFVANASHELRTPLASVLGFIETLREDPDADLATRERFLEIMQGEAQRMQRLIDDLISLSRIEAEKSRAPGDAVDLGELIGEVCAELSAGGGARATDMRIEVSPVPKVRGDRMQLSQLLHNVIGNALKYGRDGTPVTIRLVPEGAMVRLSVADQGEGIDAQHIPRLTERFYRADSGRSRAVGGTGLGLSIVRHIVERHRGRLNIASETGTGTTVTVLLPVDQLS